MNIRRKAVRKGRKQSPDSAGVVALGGGWYLMPDGRKVRGRDQLKRLLGYE